MAESVVVSVASKVIASVISSAISDLATLTLDTIRPPEIRKKVEKVRFNLAAIECKLKDVEDKPRRNWSEAYLVRQIERVAYLSQDVVEKLLWLQQQQNEARGITDTLARYCNTLKYVKTLRQIGQDMDVIESLIAHIPVMTTTLNTVIPEEGNSMVGQSGTQWSQDPRNRIPGVEDDEVAVGFDSQIEEIVKKLLDKEHTQPSIVSIVGMGGIGKSTLARKIFNHSDISTHFPIKIWIPVSQQYNVRTIQEQLLKGATQIKSEDLEKMTDRKVKEVLIESLKDVRYLIVMDDIWTTKLWDEISSIFHIKNNGSRIIQTTRKLDVAKRPKSVKNYIHEVKLLNDEASWELLERKAISPLAELSEGTINQLKSLGEQLAKKCKGLPLALIVLGGYLSNHLDDHKWLTILEDGIDWNELAIDQINISQILGLSYDDLHPPLKQIFLYITSFPESQIVRVSELTKLLIAEGFIPLGQKSSPEKKARDFVDQLHERCLVQAVTRSRAHGWITEIRIHDVLRDWGIERAQSEGFLNVIRGSDHAEVISYRVAFHGYCVDNIARANADLRTLLGFNLPEQGISFSGLKSPRVFRFSPSRAISDNLPHFIKHMIFLRYICLRNCGKINLPSSIGLLFKLQTLDCRESTMVNALPDSLWKISTLRHVYLKDVCGNWNGPRKGLGRNLRSLFIYDRVKNSTLRSYMPLMYTGLNGITEAVEEMTDIVALGLISYVGSLPENILNKISALSFLEVLELREEVSMSNRKMGLSRIPRDYVFPKSLKKIKLGCFNLVDDPMPVLGKLQKLVVLELSNVTKLDKMHISGFPVLKYFILINVLGKELNADAGAMPSLCHLKFDGCTKLQKIPRKLKERKNLKRDIINGTPHSIFA